MVEKGILYYEDSGKVRQYYPGIRREEAALAETENLLSRVYKGSIDMMMSTLVKQRSLTKEEIRELYDILEGLESREREREKNNTIHIKLLRCSLWYSLDVTR